MQVETKVGDVLQGPADVLISTVSHWSNLPGGVNGAIHCKLQNEHCKR